jgi:2-dehydropantoate 2-reductase
MKILIIGTGGVGGYFGGKLAAAGNDVTFIARGEHMKQIRAKGLKVKSILGDFQVDFVKVTDRINEVESPDLVLICVKAWQIKEILPDLKSILYRGTTILPLQNGVSAIEELKEQISEEHILGGLCRTISKIESPGVICHFGITPTIIFGEPDHSRTERLKTIKELFDRSGINSIVSDDINSDLWKKFISICVSGLLAVTGASYGELREVKETRQMMVDLFTEIYHLSWKVGAHIEPEFIEKTMSFIDTLPYESTTSLSRDFLERKPSEIDYQNGTVIRLGEKYGVDTPINRFIYFSPSLITVPF